MLHSSNAICSLSSCLFSFLNILTLCWMRLDSIRRWQFLKLSHKQNILAWTTTPWTLPSNTALAVGDHIEYVRVKCLNPYTQQPQTVILAKELLSSYFTPKMEGTYSVDERTYKGSELVGIGYRQLIDWVKPMGDAFRVISGDYVTTVVLSDYSNGYKLNICIRNNQSMSSTQRETQGVVSTMEDFQGHI